MEQALIQFIRGLYLAMNSCRPKRDRNSCKLSKQDYDSFINADIREGHMDYSGGYSEEDKAPNVVKADGRLFKHLSDLLELFKEDEPDLRLIRGGVHLW